MGFGFNSPILTGKINTCFVTKTIGIQILMKSLIPQPHPQMRHSNVAAFDQNFFYGQRAVGVRVAEHTVWE